ncbi:MAG TPA: DUF4231 domain-containing protein, partial [Mucilaginibacter sp.]|nr:DUF4231 domain-containing protein [Mucilaginibacter sp.]
MTEIKENEYPCYYIDSNRASQNAQNLYKGITWATLALMFVSTVLVSIKPEFTSQIPHFEFINGCILFISALVSVYLNYQKPERNWYLGRAIAESIKTLTWRYMMRAAPFQFQDEKNDLKNFIERIEL